jgi:hypothetical protein
MFVVLVANNRRYATRAARSSHGLFHGGSDMASVAVQARWAGRHRPRPTVAAQARRAGPPGHTEHGADGASAAARAGEGSLGGGIEELHLAGEQG